MAFSSPSLHLVISGSTGSAEQSWSTGLRLVNFEWDPTPAKMQAFVDAALPHVQTWASAVHADWATTTIWTGLRLYYYPTLPGVATHVAESTVTPYAGSSSAGMPSEIALVHTLQTALAGRRYRGRMYVPLTANANMEVNGNLSDTRTALHADATAGLVTALNAIIESGDDFGSVAVISQVGGVAEPVTSIRVDSKADSQRRREHSLVAEHVSVATV